MAKSNEVILDKVQQGKVCAILTVGGSLRTAAKYAGCTPSAIRRTAEMDESFAQRLVSAESSFEATHLSNIQLAGKKSWNASAWLLERVYPERFAKRRPSTIPIEQLHELLKRFIESINAEVEDPQRRARLERRLERLIASITAKTSRKARKQ